MTTKLILTKLGEHGDYCGLVCVVDDVIDAGRGRQAERVNPDSSLALRRGVQQRGLEADLAGVLQILFDRNLKLKCIENKDGLT